MEVIELDVGPRRGQRGRRGKKSSGMQVKKDPVCFDRAEVVEDLAKELIGQYHPNLVNCSIAYLYKNRSMKRSGRKIITTSERCSPKLKALAGYDFLIVISYPNYNELTDKQKRAAIDHALQHCFVDEDESGKTVYKILPHDFEEFGDVIRRNGLYQDDLVQLGRIMGNKKEDPIEGILSAGEDEDESDHDSSDEDDGFDTDFLGEDDV